MPRMRTDAPAPGTPELVTTCTPAALPWSALLTAGVGAARVMRSAPLTDATAPVTSARRCVP